MPNKKSVAFRAPRNVDSESRKPKLSVPVPEEPSSEEDDVLDELSLSEEDDSTKKKISSRRPSASKKKTVARSRPAPHTEDPIDRSPSPSDEGHSVSPSLALLLAVSLHLAPTSFSFPAPSCFVPYFANYFFVLVECQSLVYENNWMLKLCPYYNSLLTTIYYGILGSIQILRSRVFANIATTSEGKFFRSFEKQFPLESLPVCGPLAGFLEVLGPVKLNDAAYSWVSPCFPQFGYKINADHSASGTQRFPPLPQLMAILRNFADAWNDDEEQALWTGTNLTKFGALDLATHGKVRFLRSPGATMPAVSPDTLGSFKRFVRSLSLPRVADDYEVTGIEEYLCFPKNGEHSWFSAFIKVAAIEAQFFEGSTSLAKISPGSDLSIITETHCYGAIHDDLAADAWKTKHFAPHRIIFKDDYAAWHRIPDTATSQFQMGISAGWLTHIGTGALFATTHGESGPYFSDDAENLAKNQIAARPRPTLKWTIDKFKTPIYVSASFIVGQSFLEKGKRTTK